MNGLCRGGDRCRQRIADRALSCERRCEHAVEGIPGRGRINDVDDFRVDDIDATYEQLVKHGVDFVGAPHQVATMRDHELWMAFFEDGEGNTLALMSEVRG